MQPPILEAVRLIEDGRVQLEYVDDGQTWAVTFKGELGPDAEVEIRSKWNDSYVVDPESILAAEIEREARVWAMNNATVTFDGTSLESRALLADIMKELCGFWDATSDRAHDDDVESTARMAAMFEETAIKQCMFAVVSVANSFYANPRKRGESIAARAAAEAVGAASPDPIDLINEFIKR